MEDRLRRTAPAKSAAAAAGSSEEGSGGDEAAAKERAVPPTHSLWMLSRKFVRLLLTTQVIHPSTPLALHRHDIDLFFFLDYALSCRQHEWLHSEFSLVSASTPVCCLWG